MKTRRRIRIISTVLAMTLSFALMCFGVYAATNVTVSGTTDGGMLTFNASDICADITVSAAQNGAAAEQLTFVTAKETTLSLDLTTYKGTEYTDTVALPNFTYVATEDSYVVTVTVKNTFESNVDLTTTLKPTIANNNANLDMTVTDGTNTLSSDYTQTIEQGETATFVVTVKLAENASGFEDVKFDFTLTVERAS